MLMVDSEGRQYADSWDVCERAARDFAGERADDFDLAALARVMFTRVRTSDGVRFYALPASLCDWSQWLAAVMACDWTQWRAAPVAAGGLVAERWERLGGACYHVALFEADGAGSLAVTEVPEMGADMWDPGAGRGYDSGCPAHWGDLDVILGGRRAWRRELADVAARFIGD